MRVVCGLVRAQPNVADCAAWRLATWSGMILYLSALHRSAIDELVECVYRVLMVKSAVARHSAVVAIVARFDLV